MSLGLWYCIYNGQELSIHRALHTKHQQNKRLLSVSSFVKKACSGILALIQVLYGFTKENCAGLEETKPWVTLRQTVVKRTFIGICCGLLVFTNTNATVQSHSCAFTVSPQKWTCAVMRKWKMRWLKYLLEAMLKFFLLFFLLVMLKNAATRFLILLPIENGFDHKKKTSAYLSPLKATFRNSSWS